MINGRIYLLLTLLNLSFLLLFLYSFNSSSKSCITNYSYQQDHIHLNIRESELVQNDNEPIIFSKYRYLNQTRKSNQNAIAYLVASASGKAREVYNPYPKLRIRLGQLDERLDDNYTTDVLVFHTGYPFRGDMLSIIENSRRQVEFVNIDHIFYRFSPGFQPHFTDPTWTQRGKWNYQHMCYFWFKQIFQLKIVQRYKYLMRLDDDSQILGKWPNVFDLMVQNKALYLANQRDIDTNYILPGTTLIQNVTLAYIDNNKVVVQNPELFADVFKNKTVVPNFWNNFEIVDVSFMRRKEVMDFTEVIDKAKGIFLYRWGDAPLRYVTLALFAKPNEILHREKLGLEYCHPC